MPAREEPQVVVGAVQEQASRGERGEERREVEPGERVDEPRRPVPRELEEADLLEVVVERVGLGVERHVVGRMRRELREERVQRAGVGDEKGRLCGVSMDFGRRHGRAQG